MPAGRSVYFSPPRILILALISMIAVGAFLLWLPFCHTVAIAPIDILFTAVSACCVDGTLTIPIESFTRIGHIIILFLMQIGGLGIVTLTFFLISLFLNLNFASQLMAGQLLDVNSWKNIKQTISFIIGSALAIELIGAVALWPTIPADYTMFDRIFFAIFHSISAFCHAGFSLFPGGLISQSNNLPLLTILILLMTIGSLGFPVLYELFDDCFSWSDKKRVFLSLHTKLVLIITASSIIGGALLFFMLEYHHTLTNFSLISAITNALFNIVSARGIGLNTIEIYDLQSATLLIIMILAFIGSSPGSPGSGIKTTTFAVFCAMVKSTLREDQEVLLHGRRITRDQVNRAIAIIALTLFCLVIAFFLLLIIEQDKTFSDLLFETISSLGTLGLSTGITPLLSSLGKCIIMITIVVGRIGALLFVLALLPAPTRKEFSYPEERVMLG